MAVHRMHIMSQTVAESMDLVPDDRLLSPRDLVQLLKVSKSTLRRLEQSGQLPASLLVGIARRRAEASVRRLYFLQMPPRCRPSAELDEIKDFKASPIDGLFAFCALGPPNP